MDGPDALTFPPFFFFCVPAGAPLFLSLGAEIVAPQICSFDPAAMVGYSIAPSQKLAWLEALLTEKFFVPCNKHVSLKKNERNIFCADCSGSICQHCLASHNVHRLLQIRRYVYHDVIRLQDIQKLLDCGQVQPYIINSAKVVFLNQRPQQRPTKSVGNACRTCERSLQDLYHYCSVSCKVEGVINQQKDLSALLAVCDSLDFNFSPGSSCPPSPIDDPASQTSSGSTGNEELGLKINDPTALNSTAATSEPPLKKSRISPAMAEGQRSPKSVLNSVPSSRRKRTPHRSPLI